MESELFAARLEKIRQAMKKYPPFLGQPGKPGYRVMVQAQPEMPLATVRGMTDDQRDELLFDWEGGRQLLLTHRKYLHRLFKSMRDRERRLVWHATRAPHQRSSDGDAGGAILVLAIIVGVGFACENKASGSISSTNVAASFQLADQAGKLEACRHVAVSRGNSLKPPAKRQLYSAQNPCVRWVPHGSICLVARLNGSTLVIGCARTLSPR